MSTLECSAPRLILTNDAVGQYGLSMATGFFVFCYNQDNGLSEKCQSKVGSGRHSFKTGMFEEPTSSIDVVFAGKLLPPRRSQTEAHPD